MTRNTEMTYNNLGKCGLKVSQFSLGGWTTFGGSVTEKQTIVDIIHKAYDHGINFFDIADVYARGQAEIEMGAVLKKFPRHELVISSKVFWPMSEDVNDRGLSRKHIMESVDRSLQRVGTDYLDLYFCHRYDDNTPLEETLRAMDDLIRRGKILYWGTSEWTPSQLADAHSLCKEMGYYRPQVEQPQYSLLHRRNVEKDAGPVAHENGMGIVVWSPLGSGVLTGKYDNGVPEDSRLARMSEMKEIFLTEKNLEKVRRLKELSDQLGCSRTQLALKWASKHRYISSVILGATRVEQLEENLGALKIHLTEDLVAEMDQIFTLE